MAPDVGVTVTHEVVVLMDQLLLRSLPFQNVTVCAGGGVLPGDAENVRAAGLTDSANDSSGIPNRKIMPITKTFILGHCVALETSRFE